MSPEEIDVYKVPGLGAGTQVSNPGWVVFAKSRATNKAFYEWFNRVILKGFIDEIKTYNI